MNMINQEVLGEKLKYLIQMNSKKTQFEIMNIHIEFETENDGQKISNYDVDLKFDYHGVIDFEMYSFAHDIQRMSEKLRDVLMEYVVTSEGKIVSGENSNCYCGDPMVFNIDYAVDEKHFFELGYKFLYHD